MRWVLLLASLVVWVGSRDRPSAADELSQIAKDETVVFFPTCAHVDAQSDEWVVPIHGAIFERETSSLKRAALLGGLRRALGLNEEDAATPIFRERAGEFLVDHERGKRIRIVLAGEEHALDRSAAHGHFTGALRIDASRVAEWLARNTDESGAASRWLTYRAVTRPNDERTFEGRVEFVGPEGRSVVTDIDDTIKVTEVTDRAAMLRRTFLEEFEAVPGMADLYARWAEAGAAFHYVSSSPWQLFGPLDEFRRDEGFPAGSFHQRRLHISELTPRTLLGGHDVYKRSSIEPLLRDFPRRKFILVGDSGERDPEIYGDLARRFPDEIEAILIRNVTGDERGGARLQAAFRDVAAEKWQLFKLPEEVAR